MLKEEVINKLNRIVGAENVFTSDLDLICYSRDMSPHYGKPDVVVFARKTDEVSAILKLANEHGIPVIPRGAGTSVTGAILAVSGGIILDLSKFNKIKQINFEDRYAVVEPGVICQDLNKMLAPSSFFPPDPGSSAICTIGGMVSTNASGLRAVKYGTTKDYLLALEVVLPNGEVIRTGTKAPKSSTGFDLTKLFVAAEGTLGVITEITVRILPTPECVAFAVAYFKKIEDASRTVSQILSEGIPLAACEILDIVSIKVVNEVLKLNLPETEGMLLFSVDGNRGSVEQCIKKIEDICNHNDAINFHFSFDLKEGEKLWQARAGLVPSFSRYKEGYRLIPIAEDFGVPPSKIVDAIKAIQELAMKYNLTVATFGHVGDGNVHATFIIDVRNDAEWQNAKAMGTALIDTALKLNGTVTAEHGIGIAKRSFVRKELGRTVEIMHAIKKLFDPNNILNPHKIWYEKADILDFFAFKNIIEKHKLKQLRSIEKKIDNEILACVQCGFCRAGCPIFEQKGIESENARGKVLLAYAYMTADIEPSDMFASYFYRCTTCMNCTQTCPARIQVAKIVEYMRKKIAPTFQPEAHRIAIKNMKDFFNPFGNAVEKRTEFYPRGTKILNKDASLLLYLGCVATYQDMGIVRNAIKIFETLNLNYTTLGIDEKCCGYLAYLTGDDYFRSAMNTNLNTISKIMPEAIITTCAGCYRMFKQVYTEFSELPFEVYHITEYLHKLLKKGMLEFKNKLEKIIVYHDPCDLGRYSNIFEIPREIIAKIPAVKQVEFTYNKALAKCCGGGGGLKGFDTTLSDAIAYSRLKDAIKAGAEIVVSACPACKSNLRFASVKAKKEMNKKIDVLDIVEIIGRVI